MGCRKQQEATAPIPVLAEKDLPLGRTLDDDDGDDAEVGGNVRTKGNLSRNNLVGR